MNELESRLADKTREVDLMHSELKLVKEFRRKRGQMQKELEDVGVIKITFSYSYLIVLQDKQFLGYYIIFFGDPCSTTDL